MLGSGGKTQAIAPGVEPARDAQLDQLDQLGRQATGQRGQRRGLDQVDDLAVRQHSSALQRCLGRAASRMKRSRRLWACAASTSCCRHCISGVGKSSKTRAMGVLPSIRQAAIATTRVIDQKAATVPITYSATARHGQREAWRAITALRPQAAATTPS